MLYNDVYRVAENDISPGTNIFLAIITSLLCVLGAGIDLNVSAIYPMGTVQIVDLQVRLIGASELVCGF